MPPKKSHKCSKCDNKYASKYSLDRHTREVHRKRARSPSPDSDSESSDSDTEPSNHIWRTLTKRVLRDWDADDEKEMPKTEDELSGMKDEIREELYSEVMKLINDHQALIDSPIYQKITKTSEQLEKLMGDSVEDENEAFQSAFEQRRGLLGNFLDENLNIIDNYAQSTDEDTDSEEDQANNNDEDDE